MVLELCSQKQATGQIWLQASLLTLDMLLLLLLSRFSRVQLCDPIDGSPPGSPVPGILGKSTGVGCHFLLQCMKVKSESEVIQSCPTLGNPMDCSPRGSSIHGIFQARVLEWGAIAFSDPIAYLLVNQLDNVAEQR